MTRKIIQRKRKRRRKISFFVFIIILLIIIINIFKRIDFFNIKSIDVSGNNVLSKEEIIEKSNIALDDNLFDIKTRKSEKYLNEDTYIKDSKIQRKGINKISIEISERKESFIIQNQKGNYILIDSEGIILNLISELKENCIYISGEIINQNITEENLGTSIIDNIENDKILNFLYSFNSSEVKDITKNIVINPNEIRIELVEDQEIMFGKLRNINYKIEMIDNIIKELESKNILFSKILMDRGENPVIIRQNNPKTNDIEEEEG